MDLTLSSKSWLSIGVLFALLATQRAGAVEANNMQDDQDELLSAQGNQSSTGVSSWFVSEPYLNLWIFDQALTYPTSYNQPIGFSVAFKQRNARSNAQIFGLGPGWESSWLSYVEYTLDTSTPPKATVGATYMPLGGVRNYVADGVTKEFKSASTMTILTNVGGTVTGFQINLPSGAREVYSYLVTGTSSTNYALLSQRIDAVGHTSTFNYDTISSIARLRSMVDSDNRTNTVLYHATFTAQIKEVDGPYSTKATFGYDGTGRLTTITNTGGLIETFTYDPQNLITNLMTVYGTNSFKTTTNSYAGVNLGGTNQVNRSVLVTEADGGKQLFIYRDSSTLLNASSSTPLIPASYPSAQVPVTSPLANTFDNSLLDARNSFHWDQQQYAGLNSTFRSSGSFTDLTTNDYNIAVLQHWLRGYNNAAVVSQALSQRRDAHPDGSSAGQKTWFDYAGKVSNAWTRGTNTSPLFVGLVLPDGTTRYSYAERNQWEKPTRTIGTYSGGSAPTRTNTYTFTSDGIDLVKFNGPSSELISSNAYNGFHQVTQHFNAVNDQTLFTYDSGHRLTGVQGPTGLVTTNFYFTSGSHVGWLSSTVDYDSGTNYRTNSFTYSNGLPLTATDPRGLVVTNTWDNLNRLASVLTPSGLITNLFAKLDLSASISPSGTISNTFLYDTMRRLSQVTDPASANSNAGYVNSLLGMVTNALSQVTSFGYDFNSRQLLATLPDATSMTSRYNLLGQLTNRLDASGISVTNWYNNQGLLFASSNGFGQVFLTKFDIRDRATNQTDANAVTISTTYDDLSRVLTRSYPDGGIEQFQYSAKGLITYTNQLGFVSHFGYDALGRKIAETNANGEITQYTYNPGGDLITLVDGKNHSTQFGYDQYGRNTNVIDATGATILRFKYDQDGRLTNRWSAAKGDTFYTVDLRGNVTKVDYPTSSDILIAYDVLNRVTNMIDGVGTNSYTYTSFGALSTEGGRWLNDTITYSYQPNHLPSGFSLAQPSGPAWVETYGYDNANRLQSVVAPAGTFTYTYQAGTLIRKLQMPNGAYITNAFDNVGRETATIMANGANNPLNAHYYTYNAGNQRTHQTRWDGSYVDYTYDSIGQLKTAIGKEAGGAVRLHENLGYTYDAADNLSTRTNNALIQTFSVDSLNQLTSASRSGTMTVAGAASSTAHTVSVKVADNGNSGVAATVYFDKTFARAGVSLLNGNNTFTATAQDSNGAAATNSTSLALPISVSFSYDANGNLTSDGLRTFSYDDENQLTSILVTSNYWTTLAYDGRNRLRIRKEYNWQSGAWVQTNEVRYVYDGNLVIQERNSNNVPSVTYTRGLEIAGTERGQAGGIGGLLTRADNTALSTGIGDAFAYYHADGNGNAVLLINDGQAPVARYLYDAYGNTLAQTGSLADANVYRFSSKERLANAGLYYFGRRVYDSNLQRWVNPDPIAWRGGLNLFTYANNGPVTGTDFWGFNGDIPLGQPVTVTTDKVTAAIYRWIKWISEAELEGLEAEGAVTILAQGGLLVGAAGIGAASVYVIIQTAEYKSQAQYPIFGPRNAPPIAVTQPYPGADPHRVPTSDSSGTAPVVPPIPANPADPPGPGWEWRGNGPAGSEQGSWYNPGTGESLHPDLNHPPPIGPHWDWKDPNGKQWRIPPGGGIPVPK